MSIRKISQEEFDSLPIEKFGFFPERSWFKSTVLEIAGAVIRDPIDKDWSYVIVAREEDGFYRYIDGQVSLPSQEDAERNIITSMSAISKKGSVEEELYSEPEASFSSEASAVIISIDDQVKSYFKKNPEKMYDLAPRKFEELVASILKDMGFDVELTKATREGGRDIIAYIRNYVCSYLTHVECKRYSPENKIGVGIIREVMGVHQIRQATKSIIVTTSFFSSDAIKEAKIVENQLALKDFNDLKEWLEKY